MTSRASFTKYKGYPQFQRHYLSRRASLLLVAPPPLSPPSPFSPFSPFSLSLASPSYAPIDQISRPPSSINYFFFPLSPSPNAKEISSLATIQSASSPRHGRQVCILVERDPCGRRGQTTGSRDFS